MENKKRKKKSFFQQTVKYGKRGQFGKGSHINDEMYQYFVHVLKIYNHEFETLEEKQIFVENVFDQLSGNEVSYCCNQIISRVVDNLLPLASDKRVLNFITIFGQDLRPICSDPFASFVLQKLLITATKRFLEKGLTCTENSEQGTDNEEEKEEQTQNTGLQYKEWVLKVSMFLINNLEDFVSDSFANYIIRSALVCLACVPDLNWKDTNRKRDLLLATAPPQEVPVDKDFAKLIKMLADRLVVWPQFSELPYNDLTSGLLQVLAQTIALVDKKRLKLISRKLLDECFAVDSNETNDETKKTDVDEKLLHGNFIPTVFNNSPSLRLMEVIISLVPGKIFTQIYAKCFINKLTILAKHNMANYSVQKLILYCQEKVEYEAIFDELVNGLAEIYSVGNVGVILSLSKACVRWKTKQALFIQSWSKCLNCESQKDQSLEPKSGQSVIAPLTIFLKTNDEYLLSTSDDNTEKNKSLPITLFGCLILQEMLRFNKPFKIINSFLEMDINQLIRIICDPKGSYIANAIYDSEYIGEKSKEKLVHTLKGHYTTLALSRHGSRAFDIIWKESSLKNKITIITELSENESKLSSNQFGGAIARNISVGTFKRKKDDWIKAQNTNKKVTELFSDIL